MRVISVIQPKAPHSPLWKRAKDKEHTLAAQVPVLRSYPFTAWEHLDGTMVISSVCTPDTEQGELDVGAQYHISMTREGGKRCSSSHARQILKAFDMTDAKEDNHAPHGIARNFWRPVADKFSGYECPCQKTEAAIKEDKGDYTRRHAPQHAHA